MALRTYSLTQRSHQCYFLSLSLSLFISLFLRPLYSVSLPLSSLLSPLSYSFPSLSSPSVPLSLCLSLYPLIARESGVFLLRFSESKPGQIAISYTDYDGCENSELDSTLSEPNSLEEEFSDLNFDKKKFSRLENDNEKRKKMTVGHCLVDTVVDGLILRLANTVRKYDTLKQLLMDCKKLKFFYPHLPKAKGLECVDRFIEHLQNTVS